MLLNCRRSPTSSSKLLGPFRFLGVGLGMHRVGLLCRIDARDSSLSGCGLFEYASEIIPDKTNSTLTIEDSGIGMTKNVPRPLAKGRSRYSPLRPPGV